MDLKEILSIIFERTNASTTLWNIEFAIIGLIGWAITVQEVAKHQILRIGIVALFLSASYFNFRALIETSLQRKILIDLFNETTDNNSAVQKLHDRLRDDSYIFWPFGPVTPLRFSSPNDIKVVFYLVCIIGTLFIFMYPFTSLSNFVTKLWKRRTSNRNSKT